MGECKNGHPQGFWQYCVDDGAGGCAQFGTVAVLPEEDTQGDYAGAMRDSLAGTGGQP